MPTEAVNPQETLATAVVLNTPPLARWASSSSRSSRGERSPSRAPTRSRSCLRATRREEAFVGWRALHTLALPHVSDGVPADLRKLIQNEWDAELQPRMAEVAQAFGIDPSTR